MINLSQALQSFKVANKPLALVANEYGLVVGIVTIKDLLGGFINDLMQPQGQEMIVARDEQSWLIDGLTPINDVAKFLEIDGFPEQGQYETISGFLIYRLKKLPKLTESVVFSGYTFEVVELEGVRIERVLVTVKKWQLVLCGACILLRHLATITCDKLCFYPCVKNLFAHVKPHKLKLKRIQVLQV